MRNFSILAKFLVVMAVFGAFAIGSTIFSAISMSDIAAGYEHASARVQAARNLAGAGSSLHRVRAALAELEIANTPEADAAAWAEMTRSRNAFVAFVDDAVKSLPSLAGEGTTLRDRTAALLDGTCARAIDAARHATEIAGVDAAQTIYRRDCAPFIPPLTNIVSEMTHDLHASVQAMNIQLAKRTHDTIIITVAVIAVALVGVIIAGYFLIRSWVTNPLVDLVELMRRLSGGDLDAEVHGLDRGDEIGLMARTVQVFKQTGLEKRRLEAQAERDRAAAEAERQAADRVRATNEEQQAIVVGSLAEALGRLSQGDLTHSIDSEFAPDYQLLRTDFNKAVAELRTVMLTVTGKISAIRSGTGEISTAADDLARRTEKQAADLEETAAALDQVTQTVNRTARDAQGIQTMVAAAKTEAEAGETVVRTAVTAMVELERAAKEITQIIGIIDEISFQTNLLALNAGVEAARAGEAGRGFAVVASEVRALAQRSTDAAKEIKTLIGASTAQVGKGVTLVGDAGTALSTILGHIQSISTGVAGITTSARDQAARLAEVNNAVGQMDQVTQQNAAMVEESTAASHGLATEASELEQLIDRFDTGAGRARNAHPAAHRGGAVRISGPRSSLRVVENRHIREPAEEIA